MSRAVNSLLTFAFILQFFIYTTVGAQNIPSIICPNYFQYSTEGGRFIGIITIPNVSYGSTKLDVQLSQRSPLQNTFFGKVSLYEGFNATINRISNRQQIYYRVEFPTPNELPKLTLLAVNGQAICRDNAYPPPSSNIALDHKLTTSTDFQPVVNSRLGDAATVPQQANSPLATQQLTFLSRDAVNSVGQPTNAVPQYEQQPVTQAISTSSLDCGREGTSNTVTPFIYGGRQLFRGQFPWLTAIYLKRAEGLLFICGGTLVSTRTVVTAAHCFEKTGLSANQVLVVLGHHDLNNFSEDGDIKLELHSMRMHPEYTQKLRSDSDVAVLYLKSPVSFSNYIKPICLWQESDDVGLIAGQKASIAGWGEDEHQHAVSPLPKVVDSDIASDADCQEALRSVTGPNVKARAICVSNENGEGPCRGDSGGGLIMKRNGRWTLRGIVSSGLTRGKRCFLSEFVYFCDLAKHNNWLRANII